jgi:hypothetical protein
MCLAKSATKPAWFCNGRTFWPFPVFSLFYLTVAVAFLIDLICKCCQTNHISPPTTTLSIGNLTLRDWLHIIMLVIGYIDP